jgi:hypothetical protein
VNSDCTGTATLTNAQGASDHLNFVIVAGGREIQFIETDPTTVISGSASALGDVALPTGSIAHVASGGGWQTIFTLANIGTSSGQAKLSFFDNNGNPMSLPLTFEDSGAKTTTSVLTETIAAGNTLVVETSGTTAEVGSAILSVEGSVGGFAIFQDSKTGQETVVPLQTANASAYILAFDNTNGLSTDLDLANVSNQSANVPMVIRSDTGTKLGTATINLPVHGHTSFTLAKAYTYSNGKRGTVEFDTPPNGQISVVGLRTSATGSLSNIPVLGK